MHELGILRQIVQTIDQVAASNHIRKVKHITLEVGDSSGIVPQYMQKLFPLAVDGHPSLRRTRLNLDIVPGSGLVIKDIGY